MTGRAASLLTTGATCSVAALLPKTSLFATSTGFKATSSPEQFAGMLTCRSRLRMRSRTWPLSTPFSVLGIRASGRHQKAEQLDQGLDEIRSGTASLDLIL